MKMRNEDLKKITEVKMYLLDPPVSFKLYDYAFIYLQDAIKVLAAYPKAKDVIDYLQGIITRLKNKEIEQGELRSILKEAGIEISRLSNK
jgi:hypothetical protein